MKSREQLITPYFFDLIYIIGNFARYSAVKNFSEQLFGYIMIQIITQNAVFYLSFSKNPNYD